MFGRKNTPILETKRIELNLPMIRDFDEWSELCTKNAAFLSPWEPKRYKELHSLESFKARVNWSKESYKNATAAPFIIRRKEDNALIGVITLDNIRRGPSQAGTIGYWLGEEFTGLGFMGEALSKVVTYAFTSLDISRIEAATLKNNKPSRKLLENSGFRYEGVAQSYLQIDGRWQPHVLYANLRRDRIGATETGMS